MHDMIQRGDICRVAAPGADTRLVCVWRTFSCAGDPTLYADVLLAHAETESATDMDAIFPRCTIAPYPLVIQTDVRGYLPVGQLTLMPYKLDSAACDLLGNVIAASHGLRTVPAETTGLKLAGILDPRWQFKRTEADALNALLEHY